jgi:Uma2 family endonuclease
MPDLEAKFFSGRPDLIAEVLSPSSVRTDRTIKFDAYEQAGMPEYWIVNPKTRSVEVYTLSGQEYGLLLGEFTGDELVTSAALAGLTIITSTLFVPAN